MSLFYSNGNQDDPYGLSMAKTCIRSRPLHYQWDIMNPNMHGSCVNFHAFFVGKGIANVCLNALIFILVSTPLHIFLSSMRKAKGKADTASLASPGHAPTTDRSIDYLHARRLVSHIIHAQCSTCSPRYSVIIVSIVWIIVVPDVTQPDITCKYCPLGLIARIDLDERFLIADLNLQGEASILAYGQHLSPI